MLDTLIDFLKPFKNVSEFLQSNSNPTFCFIIFCKRYLLKLLTPLAKDSGIEKVLSETFCSIITSLIEDDQVFFYRVSLFLSCVKNLSH